MTYKLERFWTGGQMHYRMWHQKKCIDIPQNVYYDLLHRPEEARAWTWKLWQNRTEEDLAA